MSRAPGKVLGKKSQKTPYKPILPKLPNLNVITASGYDYEVLHGGVSKGNGVCFVCDSSLEKGFKIVNENLQSPESGLPAKIGDLMGDSFMVVVNNDDVLCQRCHALLSHMDRLQKELKLVQTVLRGRLVSKYCITDSNLNDVQDGDSTLVIGKRQKGPIKKTRSPGPHKCTMCDMRFDSIRAVRKHKMTDHLTTWTCHFCNEVFQEETQFIQHTRTHLSNFICDVCNESFQSEKMLTEHLTIHEQKIESEEAEAESELELANGSSSPQQVYFTCKYCDIDFVQEEVYNDHIQTHEALSCLDLNSLVKPEGLSLDEFGNNSESVDLMDINIFDHANQSNMDNRFVCGDCETEYDTIGEMNDHFHAVHEMKQCSLCPEVVGSKDEVDAHVRMVHESFSEEYPDVNDESEANTMEFETGVEKVEVEEDMLTPSQEHIEEDCEEGEETEDMLICAKCGAIAPSESVLIEHMTQCGQILTALQDAEITDEVHGLLELNEENSEEHLESEQLQLLPQFEMSNEVESIESPVGKKGRVLMCVACGESFPSKAALTEHEKGNPGHLVIGCPDCQLRFPRERNLNEHREEAHSTMHCRHCSKSFTNLKQLKAHETRHMRSLKTHFQCEICNRVFQTPTGLRHHRAVHTGEYKFKCEYCGKGFVSRCRAEEHRACHTKEKRYTCEICDLKFSVQATYWIHKKWHENPKPYKCDTCGMLFKHTSLLAVHKRKHTGERPYVCEYCDQSFMVSNSLKRHLVLHTGSFPYTCSICNVGFPAKHKLTAHMSKVHQDYTMLVEQMKKKSRNLVMAVKSPEKEKTDEGTWVLAEGTANSERYLTLQTEEGEKIFLEGVLQDQGSNQLVEIVLQGEQPETEALYEVEDVSSKQENDLIQEMQQD